MATATAPRPGMERNKSGTIDLPDRYGPAMLRWRGCLLQQGLLELQAYKEFQEIERYIDFLDGTWWDPNRPKYRSKFYDNYMADQRREALSQLSDIRPCLDISCNIESYEKQGPILDKYTRHLWFVNNLDLEVVSWLDHALFGTGFEKAVAGFNHFEFGSYGLDQVIPIACNGKLQASAAVAYRAWHPINYYMAKFGRWKCEGLDRKYGMTVNRGIAGDRFARPNGYPEYTWNSLSPAMKNRISKRARQPMRDQADQMVQPFPAIPLIEIYHDDWTINEQSHPVWVHHPDLTKEQHNYHYIVEPGARMYPRKRLTIFAGDRIMYDGPSPFWHGLYPFVMLQLNPCVWSPGGISKYRDLIPLISSINTAGAGLDDAVKAALSRNLVGVRGHVPQDVWDTLEPGKPGQKILLNPIAQVGSLRWMDAPTLPSYVGEFLRYCVDTVKRRSGSLDVQGLSKKKQVPGGDAVEQMRDSMSSPFRLEGRYLEAALEQVGTQTVSNIIQYATLDSRLALLGADGMTKEDFDYRAGTLAPAGTPMEDHWKLFPVKITPGSAHGTSRTQRDVRAFTMFKGGALSRRGLYRQTEFPEKWDVVSKEMKEEQQEFGLAPGGGKQPRQNRRQRNGSPI